MRAVLAEHLSFGAYNIASGKGQTIRQFADAVRAVVPGADIEVGPGLNPLGFRCSLLRDLRYLARAETISGSSHGSI